MKILHIEDNEDIAEGGQTYFNNMGHDYSFVLDAKKGLELIRKNRYDVILLDLMMPTFSGFDVIDSLEKDGSLKTNTIIVFSAKNFRKEEVKQLLDRGIHSVIKKPVMLDDLQKKIEMLQVH
jgi:DNA-binding response OmpR family regulator